MIRHRFFLLLILPITLMSCQSFNQYQYITEPGGKTYVRKNDNESPPGTPIQLAQVQPAQPPVVNLSNEAIRAASLNDVTNQENSKPDLAPPPACPLYRLPDLPPEPELPYDQLNKLQSAHPEEFDKVVQNQINDLYAYIDQMKKTLQESHLQYLLACQVYLNGH